ncbi:MAG: hypothetical protein ALECFALPRED_000492 [Alectoria fallacina]|uniref:Azaphilone pigments biosynthesis cluster protein L N-terminal domain-containing protein n=1 Tax=Alectoria fallacina TaxID=1903189 RepID=A0A8H3J9X7_9LECA|nr:MAG: hypothetical protein ALECFALPRED_000492 [Alectoria fallacina]
MADPLSIAAGIVGVVTAVAQISALLSKFTKSTVAAPRQAQEVLAEVSDVGEILSDLQSFLLGLDLPDRSRTSLLKVEKVVTIVSGCVLTLSELEKLLDELKTEDLDVLDCLKWARKEQAISGLIQRLQNHKASLSLVLNILNGHTITEAKDSVDRLHALVEQCYKEMSGRVQALEILDLQKSGNADWILEDDTESLVTIHALPGDLNYGEAIESEPVQFDFLEDLQRSRVYKRNQAFRTSVISALTNSVYSLGWSFFSDLSMAQVSDISVMNLAITEGECFNPERPSQTWSAQPNGRVSTDGYVDAKCTQQYMFAREPVQANISAIAWGRGPTSTQTEQGSLPRAYSPYHHLWRQLEERFGEKESARNADNLDPTSTLPPTDPLDPLSPAQVQPASSPQSYGLLADDASYWGFPESPMEQDEAVYTCKRCGERAIDGT